MSTYHVCAEGHRWQRLAACPVCGSAPATTASEQAAFETLPADAVPPVVSAFPSLDLPTGPPEAGAVPAELPRVAGYETLRVLGRGGMGVVFCGC